MRIILLFLWFGSLFKPLLACIYEDNSGLLRVNYEDLRKSRLISPKSVYDGNWKFPKSVEVSNYDSDCQPWVSGNGRRLFFVVKNVNGPERPGYQGSWDIYFSEWDSIAQTWTTPVNAGTSVNTIYAERRPTTTFNGDTMFYARNGDIYMAVWINNTWVEVAPLPQPVNSPFAEDNPALSFDGQRLYFDSNRPGGMGSKDIWVAFNRHDGFIFDSVANVGDSVNTPNVETRPYESPDGLRLYFSNFGGEPRPEGSFGNTDLYVAHWHGDHWGGVEPVAPPINSDLIVCTAYETPSGDLYVSSESWEGSRGEEDIWFAEKRESTQKKGSPLQTGGQWVNTSDLPGAIFVYDLEEGPDGVIYAATAAEDTAPVGKVFRTTDGGQSWEELAPLPGAMAVFSIAVRGDTLYAGTYPNGDVFKSVNGGLSWVPMTEINGAHAVRVVKITSNGTLLAGVSAFDTSGAKIYRSTNGGNYWSESIIIGEGLTSPIKFIYETQDGTLYAGGWTDSPPPRIWRSDNDGILWYPDTLMTLPIVPTTMDGFYESSDGTLYVTGWIHNREGMIQGGGFVFRSVDGGAHWDTTSRVVRGNVRSVRIYDIIEDLSGTIYVGFQPGPDSVVYASTNGGETWFSTGPLAGAFEALCFLYASDGYIYAGTTPNGDVFKYLPVAVKESNRSTVIVPQLISAYPNPFINRVYIKYILPEKTFISVTIYDISGKLVKTLFKGEKEGGSHFLEWNGLTGTGESAPSGIYFVNLETSQKSSILKLNYLRK